MDLQNENWVKEYINLIQARELQLENLRALVLYLIEGGEECTLTHHEVSEVFQFLQSMTFSEEKQSNYVDILWSARTRESMPQRRLKIQLLLAYEKTGQDKQEDEKYEQMIEEYRKPFFRPLDFLEIITTPNDNQ